MKLIGLVDQLRRCQVAPRRGAWIETDEEGRLCYPSEVAPRRGAWIETRWWAQTESNRRVAPRRGAWIELQLAYAMHKAAESHPAGCVDGKHYSAWALSY